MDFLNSDLMLCVLLVVATFNASVRIFGRVAFGEPLSWGWLAMDALVVMRSTVLLVR